MSTLKVFLFFLITFPFHYCGTSEQQNSTQEILFLNDSSKIEFYSTNDIVDVFEERAAKKSVLRADVVNKTVLALRLYKNQTLDSKYSNGFPVAIKTQFTEDKLNKIFYLNLTYPLSSKEEIVYLPMNLTTINWLLVKVDGVNVLYDPKLLIKITQQLQQNHTIFSSEERKILVENYVHFAILVNRDENFIDGFHGLMELTRYMGHESDLSVLEYIHIPLFEKTKYLMQANDELLGYVRNYFVPRLDSIIENAGGVEKIMDTRGGSEIVQWCLTWQVPTCVDFASYIMHIWRNVSKAFMPRLPKMSDVSLAAWKCAAIAADDEIWNFMAGLVSNNNNFQTDENLDVLQCTQNPHLYRKSLQLVIDTRKGTLEATTPVWEEFKLKILTDFVIEKFEEPQTAGVLELSSDPLVVGLLVQDLIRLHKTKKVETMGNLLKIDKFLVKHQPRLGDFVVSNLRKQLRVTLGCLRTKENAICGGLGWNRFDQLYFSWLQKNSMSVT